MMLVLFGKPKAETPFAFAAVHQLLAPMFENLELLPARQRDAVASSVSGGRSG
jgi:hypothetical protein